MSRRELKNFAIAGGAGFFVDTGVLYLALMLGAGAYASRLLSFFCAVFVTWQINRRITFSTFKSRSVFAEWCRYVTAMMFGGLVNLAIYAATLHYLPDSPETPLLGVLLGSGVALFFNFASSKFLVFNVQFKHDSLDKR